MKRDGNILKAFKGEISLRTRCKPSKKLYKRNEKHRLSNRI